MARMVEWVESEYRWKSCNSKNSRMGDRGEISHGTTCRSEEGVDEWEKSRAEVYEYEGSS